VRTESETATPSAGRLETGRPAERGRARAASLAPDVLAAGAMLTSGVLLLHWFSRITFWRDEWGILLHRRGWSVSTFLDPANEHLVALAILIYKLLLSAFGMDSPRPFQVAAVLLFLLSVALFFLYARARVGPWLALAAILPILFLGSAWDDLLFPYQLTFFGSMSCGLGALFALERRTRGGDALATLLLVGSLLFSDLGVPFVAGAAVEVVLDRERVRRAFVAVVPTLLWLAWYAGWGQTAETFISFQNAANIPGYVLNGLATSAASLFGVNRTLTGTTASPLDWGRPLLVVLIGFAGWRLYRLGRPPARTLAVLAIMLGFWTLTALNASPLTLPTVGRYQYMGVLLMLLVAVELARGLTVQRAAVMILVAVAALSALNNFNRLRNSARGLVGVAQRERAGLAGLELARGQVRPSFASFDANAAASNFLGFLDAESYFAAVDAYGSPAYTPAELADSPDTARGAADVVLASALDVKLQPVPGPPVAGCLVVAVTGGEPAVGPVPARGVVLRADTGTVRAKLRRFASESFPVDLGTVPRQAALLRIPVDRSDRPWILELSGKGRASVCRPSAG
jgi:hypothetical protein